MCFVPSCIFFRMQLKQYWGANLALPQKYWCDVCRATLKQKQEGRLKVWHIWTDLVWAHDDDEEKQKREKNIYFQVE